MHPTPSFIKPRREPRHTAHERRPHHFWPVASAARYDLFWRCGQNLVWDGHQAPTTRLRRNSDAKFNLLRLTSRVIQLQP